MVELQKQIQRGEETYYEETQAHGSSLYRGFETFIDARDVGTLSGPSSSSSRRKQRQSQSQPQEQRTLTLTQQRQKQVEEELHELLTSPMPW